MKHNMFLVVTAPVKDNNLEGWKLLEQKTNYGGLKGTLSVLANHNIVL